MRRLIIMLGSAAATLGVVVALVLAWGLWSYQGPGPATDGAGSTSTDRLPSSAICSAAAFQARTHGATIRSASV